MIEQVPSSVSTKVINATDQSNEVWSDILEDDSPIPLDASEGGFFSGNFVPPPPRPLFLDETATPDGLTTCDLCSWSFQYQGGGFNVDASKETPELGWVLTLIIVSLISALIGAIVMIVVLHCKRLKTTPVDESERGVALNHRMVAQRPPINIPDDKEISTITSTTFPNLPNIQNSNNGVWSWLSRRNVSSPSPLNTPPTLPAENHYTHMEDGYNSVGEGLYAELDRESASEDNDRDSNSPAYQNSAYTDPDAPASSAPSSAYYSDLSTTTVPERAYEIVGLVTMPPWDNNTGGCEQRRPGQRLAAISESSASVPSDYV
ncbi:uncharacterized protein LOC130440433 isoform X1 [Diorhabda sublineata]|uniref:uncharacterized protein LOC130440433 isoform X1 n=1 Tax=Diorhabda sublineata TaxID=1163346 RepID=UPI0024E072F8|nr:uncharacterized protein LOC130440433 isoform X1 [Diorhabda sublineata]